MSIDPVASSCARPACGAYGIALTIALASLLLTAAASAQTQPDPAVEPGARGPLQIVCTGPEWNTEAPSCGATVSNADLLQQRVLRLRVVDADGRGVGDALVRFRATAGAVMPDTVRTDASGYASGLWYRTRAADPAGVTAEARTETQSAMRHIEITPRGAEPAKRYQVKISTGNNQAWYEKSPQRFPLVVEIRRAGKEGDTIGQPITDPVECAAQRVAFSRIGTAGALTPDTTRGSVFPASERRPWWRRSPAKGGVICEARANWTLGEGAGRRHARATLLGDAVLPSRKDVQFETVARALPRLIAGIGPTRNRGYLGAKAGEQRIVRVERQFPDGTKLAFDSTVSSPAAVDEVGSSWSVAPIVGVSAAVIPRLERFSLTAGVSLTSPQDDWYAGFSLLRPFGRLGMEGLPIDVHLLGHWGRRAVLANVDACRTEGSCRTEEDVMWHGAAAMVSIDAGSLVADLIKKLGS